MAKTTAPAPQAPIPEPTVRDLLGLSARAHPNLAPEGMPLSDFLNLLSGGARRWFRVDIDSEPTWVERRNDGTYWTANRDPQELDQWALTYFHGSPARPQVRVSPVSYVRPAVVSPLNDCATAWCTFPVALDLNNQGRLPFPAIVKASRDRIRATIADFPVSPWGYIDAGVEITAIWRLSELVNYDYLAIIVDKIALVTGARRLNIRSFGPERGAVSLLGQRGNLLGAAQMRGQIEKDEFRRALTEVNWFAPGQAAKVSPRLVVDCTILGDATAGVKIEDLAKWVMPETQD